MSTQFEEIVEGFAKGSLTLEAACQELTSASQADPTRTRFWGQRVETEMKRGRIPPAAARTMLDALEGFQCDKTMWLDPSMGLTRSAPATTAPPTSSIPAQSTELAKPVAASKDAKDMASTEMRSAKAEPVNAAQHSAALGSLSLGTVIKDRYQLVAHLGAGGIGQVFDAIDLHQAAEVHVTLKVVAVNLRHEPYAFDALKAAVRATQHLDHPNIVRVYDIDEHEDRVFITMEPLRGRWLSGLVREVRRKGMTYESAWPIIAGIANGLAYAHQKGLVHSDLSPHAVFVGDDGTAKIMGFGLVHAVPTSNESLDVLDTLTLSAYTEAYTADVWAQQGTPHPADDLYPLGIIAYEMLTGLHPFQRCTLNVARQKELTYTPIAGLPRRARVLIDRCLSFDRDVRPKDGNSFLKRMRPNVFERLWNVSAASA
jgi:Protein kinase domain